MSTLSDFFSVPSESEIAQQQTEIREKLAKAAQFLTAIESTDSDTRLAAFRELGKMRYAHKVDGDNEGQYFWELTSGVEYDREFVSKTPAQIIARMDLDR